LDGEKTSQNNRGTLTQVSYHDNIIKLVATPVYTQRGLADRKLYLIRYI